jgi:hypothetical protein
MEPSIVELSKELTLVLVQTGNLSAENMQAMLQKIYETLIMLKVQEEATTFVLVPAPSTAAVDWRKSITRQTVTCLECGQVFKQLSHPPSEKARTKQPFVPDEVWYPMDTATCRPGHHDAAPAGRPGSTPLGEVANVSQKADTQWPHIA